MKTVGIMTLFHNNNNYGGQLQAYALQQYIEKLGYDTVIIDCELASTQGKLERFKYLGLFKSLKILSMKFYMKINMYNHHFKTRMISRKSKFAAFQESIKRSPLCNQANIANILPQYDYYITGSDQVWNPSLWKGVLFLNFVPSKLPKIAYAASLGVSNITREEYMRFKSALQDFRAVSVRELGAKQLLYGTYENEIQVVLDPVFLHTKVFWDQIVITSNTSEPYVFVYMIHPNDLARKKVFDFCRRNKLRMISIPHAQGWYKKADDKYCDIPIYDIGPKDWVGYIKNANYIFTDSFHGTAFSILYNKNFWSFEKKDSPEHPVACQRIESLLLQLGISNRKIQADTFPDDSDLVSPIDYVSVNCNLNALRNFSSDFLKNTLS